MIFNFLEKKRSKCAGLSFALIDPDVKNDNKLPSIIMNINKSNFDAMLVGGSKIEDQKFESRLKFIKKNTDLPVILFPGSSSQVSKHADAILFTSLLSGRNPRFLIEEQVKSSQKIYKYNLETIPTGYLLLKTDKISAVEMVSSTTPLSMQNISLVKSHALAAQYLGNKFLFLECGSNADRSADTKLISAVSSVIDIPLIVGGGIKDKKTAIDTIKAGAQYIVIGTLLEESNDLDIFTDINNAIHEESII